MKAALARAAGYIAPNSYEVEKESTPADEAAIKAELLANSLRWFAEDAAEDAGADVKTEKIEKILSDTRQRRWRLHLIYFLECSDLCYIGK